MVGEVLTVAEAVLGLEQLRGKEMNLGLGFKEGEEMNLRRGEFGDEHGEREDSIVACWFLSQKLE